MLARAVEEWAGALEETLGESDATRGHVEEVDRRPLGVRRAHLDGETEVVRVAHQEQRREAVQQIAVPVSAISTRSFGQPATTRSGSEHQNAVV